MPKFCKSVKICSAHLQIHAVSAVENVGPFTSNHTHIEKQCLNIEWDFITRKKKIPHLEKKYGRLPPTSLSFSRVP